MLKLNQLEQYVKPIKVAIASQKTMIEIEWIGVKEKVQTITMHEIVGLVRRLGYDNIDLPKMDIEGAEIDVLLSNNSWLSHVKRIVMELHPQVYGYSGVSEIVQGLIEKRFESKIIHRVVDTRYALREWIDRTKSPYSSTLTLWKSMVSIFAKSLDLQYLMAERKTLETDHKF